MELSALFFPRRAREEELGARSLARNIFEYRGQADAEAISVDAGLGDHALESAGDDTAAGKNPFGREDCG